MLSSGILNRPYMGCMSNDDQMPAVAPATPAPAPAQAPKPKAPPMPKEIGGPKGPEPTRFGDWEQKGRATDF